MSNIDKQALRMRNYLDTALKSGVKLLHLSTDELESLLDENLQLQRDKDSLEAVAVAMRDDMRDAREKLDAAEKRIAELEARNASTNLPGGFSIEEARTLHTNLVSGHISKAMSGEKMNKARKEADLRWIHSVLVSAAWFVKASIEDAGIGKGE